MTHPHVHGGHAHGHAHAAPAGGRAFLIGIVLNLSFVLIEAGFGIASHSMALVADAGHNLSDVLGLALAGAAMLVARRQPTKRRTYGMRGTTILASLVNAMVLLFVTGGVAWESVLRFASPQPIASKTVIIVALVGVVINGSSALLFLRDKKRDLNARSAYLHLAADAALSFGVAISGAVMLATGWLWLDPAVSIVLAIIILVGTWSLFKSSFHLAMQGVPEHIDIEGVRAYLTGLPGVSHVHDLHVWAMSTTEVALTAHIVVPYDRCAPRFLNDVAAHLHDAFAIEHATLQIEAPDDDPCALAADHKV